MLRAMPVGGDGAQAGAPERERTRVRVAEGELKISCGEDVVLDAALSEECAAVALFDPVARVGGVFVGARAGTAPDAAAFAEARFREATRDLLDAIVRMGGVRGRLTALWVGEIPWLGLLLPSTPPRAPRRGGPAGLGPRARLIVDLGAGRAWVAAGAAGEEG